MKEKVFFYRDHATFKNLVLIMFVDVIHSCLQLPSND